MVVTWELNAVRKIFFWPILLKSVQQPKKILVGLAMLMQWGVFLCGVKKTGTSLLLCVCVCLCLCLCVCEKQKKRKGQEEKKD